MKIEAGKSYVARDGEVWMNARLAKGYDKGEGYTWTLDDNNGEEFSFTVDGKFWLDDDEVCEHDLVSQIGVEVVSSSAIRTVTRREIVPGKYGIVEVGEVSVSRARIATTVEYGFTSVDQLREAANLFNQLAEVLEENAKEAA